MKAPPDQFRPRLRGVPSDDQHRRDLAMLRDVKRRLESKMRALGMVKDPASRLVNCNHGVLWTTCTVCSKPVTTRAGKGE